MNNAKMLDVHQKNQGKTNGEYSSASIKDASGETIRLLQARSGHLVMQVLNDKGSWISMHSMVDPLAEAKKLYSTHIPGNRLVIILGAAMGYHIDEIINHAEPETIIIVEKEHAVISMLHASRNIESWFARKKVYFISGKTSKESIDEITRLQISHDFRTFYFIEHAPSVRAFPDYYSYIKKRLEGANKINLAGKLYYKKFIEEKLNILILHSKYYLLPEILNSLKKLGHSTRLVMVSSEKDAEGAQETLENILQEIITFRPDFVLTVNHLGFDQEGILTRLFTDMELPYASWYVDSPVFILRNYKNQISPYLTIFLWDRDYIDDLKKCGFTNIYYLPLATDTTIFKQIDSEHPLYRRFMCPVSFVGNSGKSIIEECLSKMDAGVAEIALINKVAKIFLHSKERYIHNILLSLSTDEQAACNMLLENKKEIFEPAVTWKATQMYRLACVRKISGHNAHIYGDHGWQMYLNGDTVLSPELNYYDEVPFLYNASYINFNSTSMQMKNGVNQRVFDVPGCCSFLITDYKKQLSELYEIGEEVICYSDAEEIPGLLSFYLRHDGERRKIAQNAYRRTMRNHTYMHRLISLTSKMKKLYG